MALSRANASRSFSRPRRAARSSKPRVPVTENLWHDRYSRAVVDQNEVSRERNRKRDHRSFAIVERLRSRIIEDRGRAHLEPGGRILDPGTYRCGCLAVRQLVAHGRRREHFSKSAGSMLFCSIGTR